MTSSFDPRAVRAMVFDTFGTVVDWRGSIIAEGESYWKAQKGVDIDTGVVTPFIAGRRAASAFAQ